MKLMKQSMLITAMALSSVIALKSNASQNCATCGGYFYTAVAETNNSGIISQQFARRGPYASYDECIQAKDIDLANNDSWLPFFGSPICTFQFESDYDAYEEILDSWNLASAPSGNGVDSMSNEELIRKINILRDEFNIDLYERKVKAVITDPEL